MLFEKASRLKLRFKTSNGQLSTEDLWELSLERLDELAKSLNKEVKEASEESFIKTRSKSNVELETKFEVVKRIIEVKMAEKAEKADRLAKAERKQKLQEILDKKKDSALEAKTIQELEAELASM